MPKKILLVDDEAGFTQLLKMNLERSGSYQVRIENDSLKAVETAREFGPDVIILDVVMPGMDGGDVQAALADHPMLRSTPVIMLTALVESSELPSDSVAQAGENIVLPKPVDINLLTRAIEEAIV